MGTAMETLTNQVGQFVGVLERGEREVRETRRDRDVGREGDQEG